MYTALIFSWQSSYISRIFTLRISINSLFATFYLISCFFPLLIGFLLTILYSFFNPNLIISIWASYAYNVGIITPVLLFFASTNNKKIDLHKTRKLNFQGLSFSHFIIILVLILSYPILILVSYFLFDHLFLYSFLLGILGVFFSTVLITRKFNDTLFSKKKYRMIKGFLS